MKQIFNDVRSHSKLYWSEKVAGGCLSNESGNAQSAKALLKARKSRFEKACYVECSEVFQEWLIELSANRRRR